MLDHNTYIRSIAGAIDSQGRLSSARGHAGKVAALLFIVVAVCATPVQDSDVINLSMFEFTSEFDTILGNCRLDGLMASDGSCHRIAIYWIEHAVFRDSTFFLGYSDFIFSEELVYYWIHGVKKPGTFHLSDKTSDPLLPKAVSVESVVRSALAILSRIRYQPEQTDTTLEVGKFFRQSRYQTDYSYEVLSEQTSSDLTSVSSASDVQILNALPYGRKYSKSRLSDGTLVWSARRALNDKPVVIVTVKPVSIMQKDDDGRVFDTETLGQWKCVPDAYRAYWSFERAYSELKNEPDYRVSSRELYDNVESYLDNNKVPAHVCLALNQLRFKSALITGDTRLICQSAQAVVTALCRDVSVSDYQCLLELARIDAQIREQYPQRADELVQPLVGQMVKHAGQDAPSSLDRLMMAIHRNKWFRYGKLLLEEVRSQGLLEKDILNTFAAGLETARLARELQPSDPCESSATVKQYLALLDANPPRGTITMDDVRHILTKGLARYGKYASATVIEDVVRSIRMIAGEGPFRGNQSELTKSIEIFSWLYLVVDRNREPIDTVLSTFLALSFCDITTAEDHDVLFSQIRKLSAKLQSLTNSMLTERGLSSLVDPNDVKSVFSKYEQKCQRYIDDPICPMFKFPWTANEEIRITNKLKLRFLELEDTFDEISLKVKYAGASKKLKDETLYKISLAAQQLLPESAFLRKPSYPGVRCRYRGRYGFITVIREPLYNDSKRAKERFKAMKYFHLGHRLEEIVKRERELSVVR